MEVHRHNAICPGRLQEVCNQPSGNRLAATVLLILAGIGVEGENCCDALCRSTLKRVDHNELFHQPLVQRLWVGLQDESIATADGFLEANEDLAIGEVAGGGGGELDT